MTYKYVNVPKPILENPEGEWWWKKGPAGWRPCWVIKSRSSNIMTTDSPAYQSPNLLDDDPSTKDYLWTGPIPEPPKEKKEMSILKVLASWAFEHNCMLGIVWNDYGYYQVHFITNGGSGAEVKKGYGLLGEWGGGLTPEDAAKDYAQRISGKTLVFDAMDEKWRKERVFPIVLGG